MENQQSNIFFQLVSSQDFRDWVQHPNEERNYYWEKWMEANPEKIGDLQKAREFMERMVFKKDQLQSFELDELLLKIISSEKPVGSPLDQKARLWKRKNTWLNVAAILMVFLIAAWVVHRTAIHQGTDAAGAAVAWKIIENPKGKKSKITLPDGSQVNLNYESSLRFPEAFEGEVRKVELLGEAFFDVAHNDTIPFMVVTGELETMVLGTSFNIQSKMDGQETDISLVTGKVKINRTNDRQKSIELSPGEQLRYNRLAGTAEKKTFDVRRVTAWKDGIILFEDAGFDDFIDQLEKWYGVNFQIHGTVPQNWKVNGRYQNEKLDDILSGLSFVYGLEYKIQGNNVILNLQ